MMAKGRKQWRERKINGTHRKQCHKKERMMAEGESDNIGEKSSTIGKASAKGKE
jgi:hypothetical protein